MALTHDDLQAISNLLSETIERKLEEKLGQQLEEKLDKKFDEKLQPIYRDIRSLKLKVNKTWKLLSWFVKDADERIVNNTRRIEKLEKLTHHN